MPPKCPECGRRAAPDDIAAHEPDCAAPWLYAVFVKAMIEQAVGW